MWKRLIPKQLQITAGARARLAQFLPESVRSLKTKTYYATIGALGLVFFSSDALALPVDLGAADPSIHRQAIVQTAANHLE